MSKVIKITQSEIDGLCEDFKKAISDLKMSDGKVTFSKAIGTIDRKATLFFTEIAYIKMLKLVREFDKEIAWHGIAERGEDPDKDEYIIKDILVYPQEVTSTTVTTDQTRYQDWLYSHDDDVFNNIRMQGHSHVNMSTTPSGVDTTLYERILDQLDDSMFYIFLIWNKRDEKTIKIYDMAKNILFETADVDVKTVDEYDLSGFMKDAKEMVKTTTWNTKPATTQTTKATDKIEKKEEKKGEKRWQDVIDTSKKRTPIKSGWDDDDWGDGYGYGYNYGYGYGRGNYWY